MRLLCYVHYLSPAKLTVAPVKPNFANALAYLANTISFHL